MEDTSSSDSNAAVAIFSTATAATAVVSFAASCRRRRRRGGSRVGKARNRNGILDHDLGRGGQTIDREYFCCYTDAQPIFTEPEFERRYRVPREIYEIFVPGVLNVDGYFRESTDVLGARCATSDQTITAPMRQLL
jgi:hypothetical protein